MSYLQKNGMPRLSTYLTVADTVSSMDFYKNVFGFEVRGTPETQNGSIKHCEMSFGDAVIMLQPANTNNVTAETNTPSSSGIKSPVSLYIYCDDVDALYSKAITAGAISISAPTDETWGDRQCILQDINGYYWSFATCKVSA